LGGDIDHILKMPEESNLLGTDNEKEARVFFERICKWKHLTSNFDIKAARSSRKTFGLDHVFRCFDPIMGQTTNILVECRYRKDHKTVNRKTMLEMITELKKKITVAKNSPTWATTTFCDEINLAIFKLGCVFTKIKKYDPEKYMKDLQSIQLEDTDKEDPPIIGLLSNYRLSKIIEVVQNKKNLQFYYPVYGKNKSAMEAPYLSFTYLFSDIIIGKYLKQTREKGSEQEEEVYFVLSFEKPSKESVNYIRNATLLWNLYSDVKELYFTEGNNLNIQEYNSYKVPEDVFEIKIVGGDPTLNFKMEDKVYAGNS